MHNSSIPMVDSGAIKLPLLRLCSRLPPRAEFRYCKRDGSQATAESRAAPKVPAASWMVLWPRISRGEKNKIQVPAAKIRNKTSMYPK